MKNSSIRRHAGLLADTAGCVRDSKPRVTATPTGQCTYDGRPAHEIRTGDLGNRYGLCFDCAQSWQAVRVRREDVPQVAALARSLYAAAAERAGYTVTRQPEPAPVEDTLDLNKVVAALPEVVDHAMQTAIPHRYTPELAEAIAADICARLTGDTTTPCPDGVAWCDGDPVNHNDTDDHRHQGPEHTLNGSYLCDPTSGGTATFQMAQWPDGQPHLVFQGSGLWADINLAQVDELIADAVPWLIQLISTRRRLAIELEPSRTPFAESEDKQTASAAFDLATKAADVALAKTEGRPGMFRALRNFLDLTEDEQAGGDR